MAFELNNIKTYNTLIYDLIANSLNLNKNYIEPVTRDHDTYVSGGYVEKNLIFYKYDHIAKNNIWKLNENQIKNFEKNIALLKDKNIQIILVTPHYKIYV